MLLDNYLRNLPWVIPTCLLGLALLWWLAPRVQRVPRWLTVLAGMSAVGFVALVATPSHRALTSDEAGTFDWSVRIPGPRDLLVFTELGLNIWIALPMGLFGVLLARRLGRLWPVVVAFAVPLSCELLQWAVPSMGRVGFQLSDLAANWTGVLVGALATALVLRLRAPSVSPAPPAM